MEEYIRLTEEYRDQRLNKVPEEIREDLKFARAQVYRFRQKQAKKGIRNPWTPYTDEEQKQRHREQARRYYEANKDKADAAKRQYVATHPDKVARAKAKYAAENPEKMFDTKRRHHIEKTYGLSYDDWKVMADEQGYRCKICTRTLDPQTWATDHCHQTGKIRGILCHHCNWGLGHFMDDPYRLMMAIEYLTSSEDHSNYCHDDASPKFS